MLRDPAERAYSHYKMEKEKRTLEMDFESAINQELMLLRHVGLSEAPPLPENATQSDLKIFVDRLASKHFQTPDMDQLEMDRAHNQVLLNLTKTNFLQRGMYSTQLERWLKYFPLGEQIMIIKFEDFQASPAKVYHEILDFLGAPSFDPEDYNKKWHTRGRARQKGVAVPPLSNETRMYLEKFYEPYNNELAALLGERLYD